ncbi:MAG TPA: hypothetical protein EYH34_15180 [Planctomycetes bacterium]|nr:hypothetical protein [Planctomycetota bacterium]
MRSGRAWLAALLVAGVARAEADGPPAIRSVQTGPNRQLQVNGQPFLPIMAWLQDPENFPALKQCGMNTTAGYWPGSGGTKDVVEYMDRVAEAGLYGVLPHEQRLHGHPNLLGYIHGDEPDLPRQLSDAQVVPGAGLRLNPSTPLWKIVDGVWHTWSVLDPLEGATVTIRLRQPVTVHSLAVWLTVSPGLAVAKDVVFRGDDRVILEATLKAEKGRQELRLPRPSTFRELSLTVRSVYPGRHVWGSIGEIEGLDADGRNLLVCPPRYAPRADPEKTLAVYRRIKSQDASRPVFMTLTGNFHPHFQKWSDAQRKQLYPRYIEAADVVGYDIYPIYGWNKPEWIHLVYEATERLSRLAGPRPVYAWIETSRGGQWTGPLERQKAVTPQHIRAEVWMAITGGATAIGYFTHVWKPAYRQFGVPEENRLALREINAQLQRLAPAILAPPPARPVRWTAHDDLRVAALARQHNGAVYLFAVNYDPRLKHTSVRFALDGLRPGQQVTVVDEGRRINAHDGSFTDTFEPLAVHIYRVDLR